MARTCTVNMYLHVLTHELTRYDMAQSLREMRRGGRTNIYRLGHLLGAKQKVEDAVDSLKTRADPEALGHLRESIQHNFEAGFPPAKAVLRQIETGRCMLRKR